ncbi:hypothetical protein DIPPA_07713 [Diplonema papillatum]|nr:hypothetical protein DIPPA_07713 [Diplonema papillatum]
MEKMGNDEGAPDLDLSDLVRDLQALCYLPETEEPQESPLDTVPTLESFGSPGPPELQKEPDTQLEAARGDEQQEDRQEDTNAAEGAKDEPTAGADAGANTAAELAPPSRAKVLWLLDDEELQELALGGLPASGENELSKEPAPGEPSPYCGAGGPAPSAGGADRRDGAARAAEAHQAAKHAAYPLQAHPFGLGGGGLPQVPLQGGLPHVRHAVHHHHHHHYFHAHPFHHHFHAHHAEHFPPWAFANVYPPST